MCFMDRQKERGRCRCRAERCGPSGADWRGSPVGGPIASSRADFPSNCSVVVRGCTCGSLRFSFQFCQFLLHKFRRCFLVRTHLASVAAFIIMQCLPLFLAISLAAKPTSSDINIVSFVFFFWLMFTWFFFHFLTFNLPISYLKFISCRQHIVESCFLVRSANPCPFIGAFRPFTFNVVFNSLELASTILFCFVFDLFPCFLFLSLLSVGCSTFFRIPFSVNYCVFMLVSLCVLGFLLLFEGSLEHLLFRELYCFFIV